jgi:hypothetical protein
MKFKKLKAKTDTNSKDTAKVAIVLFVVPVQFVFLSLYRIVKKHHGKTARKIFDQARS